VAGYKLQALNEYVCMRLAIRCRLRTAEVDYRLFEDEPALIVKRFDRVEEDGKTIRLHHEDLCQSLSVMPDMKYTSDGGPSTYDVLKLLSSTGAQAHANLRDFTSYIFFNCLIGAPDAHAKNYSLLLSEGEGVTLAPLYDVASALAYEGMARDGRLAMAIGDENRFGRVGKGAIERYAAGGSKAVGAAMAAAGLDAVGCKNLMADLAERIPRELELVFDECAHIPGAEDLRCHLLAPVRANCARTLDII
jgi:serine/threonine-protein kinase HipA